MKIMKWSFVDNLTYENWKKNICIKFWNDQTMYVCMCMCVWCILEIIVLICGYCVLHLHHSSVKKNNDKRLCNKKKNGDTKRPWERENQEISKIPSVNDTKIHLERLWMGSVFRYRRIFFNESPRITVYYMIEY